MADKTAENDKYVTEWEKSLEAVGKFDGVLVDLRKYGFTIITGLIGVGTFFQLGLGIQNAILLTNMTLIVALYWLDLYYRNALTGALVRSIFLEMFRLNMGLSHNISTMYGKTRAEYYTVVLYAGLFLTSSFIAVALNATTATPQIPKLNDSIKYEKSFKDPITGNQTDIIYSRTTEILKDSSKGTLTESRSNANETNLFLLANPSYFIDVKRILSQPLIFSFFVFGAFFLFIMYLASRQRRRTFAQTMKVYDYCFQLKYEKATIDLGRIFEDVTAKALEDVLHRVSIDELMEMYKQTVPEQLSDDFQRVTNKVLKNVERDNSGLLDSKSSEIGQPYWNYRFSMNIGPLQKHDKVPLHELSHKSIKVGYIGTLLVIRKKGLMYKLWGESVSFQWALVSSFGILVLNPIKMLQWWLIRPEANLYETDNIDLNHLPEKLNEIKIVENDLNDLKLLYTFYIQKERYKYSYSMENGKTDTSQAVSVTRLREQNRHRGYL